MPSTMSSSVVRLKLLDRDDAFVADLCHRLGDHVADFLVAVGRNRANLSDLVVRLDLLGTLFEILDDDVHGLLDAAFEIHRICTRSDRLRTFAYNGAGKDGRGGGAIARCIAGFTSNFAHHLRAHILKFVGRLLISLATVMPSFVVRGAPKLVIDHHIAALY